MTDLDRAIAAARQQIDRIKAVPNAGMTNAEHALDHLLAALDAARGEAVYFTALPSGEYIKTKNDSLKEKGYRVVTAYLAPQAPPDLVTQLDHARRRIGQLTIQLGEVMKAPPAAVPEGYVLVPVEPTTAMKCRAVEAWEGPAVYKSMFARGLADLEDKAAECWAAMLAATNKENNND